MAVVIAPTRRILVAGYTFSSDFPGTSGGAQPESGGQFDGFVSSLDPSLTVFLEPTSKADCMTGGWRDFPSLGFKNQGDCVSWVVTNGRNPPGGR